MGKLRAWSSVRHRVLSSRITTCRLSLGEKNNLLVFRFMGFGYCLTWNWEHSTNTGQARLRRPKFSPPTWRGRTLPTTHCRETRQPAWGRQNHQITLPENIPCQRVWRPSWILSFGNFNWRCREMVIYLTEEGEIKTKTRTSLVVQWLRIHLPM